MSSHITIDAKNDVVVGTSEQTQQVQKNGRTIRPISFGMGGRAKAMTGTLICTCAVAITCFIVGGIMWGTCSDPDNTSGCNESVLRAGKAIVFTGVGSVTISLIACVGYALIEAVGVGSNPKACRCC